MVGEVNPDAAVMVSGNAMAHVYLDLGRRERPWWPALAARHESLTQVLLAREAVDLLLLPHAPGRCEVRSRGRGSAEVEQIGDRFRYVRASGDPLGVGADVEGDADAIVRRDMRTATIPTRIVQIATLAGSSRAGDMILSAPRRAGTSARATSRSRTGARTARCTASTCSCRC